VSMRNSLLILTLSVLIISISCNKDDDPTGLAGELSFITTPALALNPTGAAPLSAEITFSTEEPVIVEVRVHGQNGQESDVVHQYTSPQTQFEIPVLGLYPDAENQVDLVFLDSDGNVLDDMTLEVTTDELIPEMPTVRIDKSSSGGIKPGFNLVNYFGIIDGGDFVPQRPLMFDAFGDIRWYLDYTDHPDLGNLFYDNGLIQLANGNFLFGDGNSQTLYEIDMLGAIINSWSLQGFGFHHHVLEKPNGNFLVTVNDFSKPTVEDVIIEINRVSGSIINTWDLNVSLDNQRRAWETDLADLNIDWFHANAVAYSADDNSILVSGRTQGTVKLTANNEVVWILAPHLSWGTAGNGMDLNQFLLQPLDANGALITDEQVLNGFTNHPDFEWAWYQHSPILLPNGNVMIFDNGDNRNYTQPGTYSRAVEYKIDEENMTIQQVWSYGKGRGEETYSRIVSKVNYHSNENTVLFTPGAVNFNGNRGKVVEVNHITGEVLFEASVVPPVAPFNIAFHNVQRVELYGNQ